MGSDGVRNEERLCWLGPAAIYWTGLDWIGSEAVLEATFSEYIS
jgi:hypothetical protein